MPFNQWMKEMSEHQNYLSFKRLCQPAFWQQTNPQLKLSYNLHIKKAYVLSATWISLLILKYLNFCATQVSYISFWCLVQIHHK